MRIFVGSSKENLDTLADICTILEENDCTPIPWNEAGLFIAGKTTCNTLIGLAQDDVDAAILLYSPDDRIWYREDKMSQARDNVLFEHGLFTGALGLDKAIIIKNGSMKMPSDLSGVTYISYGKTTKSRAKQEIKTWINDLRKNKATETAQTDIPIDFSHPHLKTLISVNEDMKESMISYSMEVLTEAYENFENAELEPYVMYILIGFVNKFFGMNDARFTIRQYDEDSNSMVTLYTTRDGLVPGPIPLDKPNMISESAKQDKPLVYSEHKDFHYNTDNNSIKKGVYKDYVTFTLISGEKNKIPLPIWSLCLDVKNNSDVNRMKALVHCHYFEMICTPIIDKLIFEIEKNEPTN